MIPQKLVLDAGPLIALFHASDRDHEAAVRGFRALVERNSRLLTPLPVVFEVYEWLLLEGGPAVARRAPERMVEALEIVPMRAEDLEAIQVLLAGRPDWRGTLEDASVVLLALRAKASVWTLNRWDLGEFRELLFWTG